MITRQLKTFLPVNEEFGLNYFNAYGLDTKQQWTDFKLSFQLLEAWLTGPIKDN